MLFGQNTIENVWKKNEKYCFTSETVSVFAFHFAFYKNAWNVKDDDDFDMFGHYFSFSVLCIVLNFIKILIKNFEDK